MYLRCFGDDNCFTFSYSAMHGRISLRYCKVAAAVRPVLSAPSCTQFSCLLRWLLSELIESHSNPATWMCVGGTICTRFEHRSNPFHPDDASSTTSPNSMRGDHVFWISSCFHSSNSAENACTNSTRMPYALHQWQLKHLSTHASSSQPAQNVPTRTWLPSRALRRRLAVWNCMRSTEVRHAACVWIALYKGSWRRNDGQERRMEVTACN